MKQHKTASACVPGHPYSLFPVTVSPASPSPDPIGVKFRVADQDVGTTGEHSDTSIPGRIPGFVIPDVHHHPSPALSPEAEASLRTLETPSLDDRTIDLHPGAIRQFGEAARPRQDCEVYREAWPVICPRSSPSGRSDSDRSP